MPPLCRALMWPAAAVVAGSLFFWNVFGAPADDAKPQSNPSAAVSAAPRETAPAVVSPLPRSVPTRLRIPGIAVNAPFTPLDIGASGHLNPPPADNANMVGWYRHGATPGERGTAIVAGHVDTKTGPAVFLYLRTMKRGSAVDITRQDGSVATFKVDSVETFSKTDFPNDRVYADTPGPELRLITCGGTYDRAAQDYEDNVVVFAHLHSVKHS
ncbi:class F sortase [Streptomyces sp. NBC_00344]|uniref:class F sortase n=1 Tax=Streptomyces sp. NBC_00344 TaxID=2975720 RepID=UPI002E2101C7